MVSVKENCWGKRKPTVGWLVRKRWIFLKIFKHFGNREPWRILVSLGGFFFGKIIFLHGEIFTFPYNFFFFFCLSILFNVNGKATTMWPTHPPCFINFHISFGSQKIWLILSMGGWSDDRYFGYITRKNIIKKQTLGKWRERERERERERVAKPYCSHSITNQRLTRNCQKAFWELHESSTHWH